MHQKVQQKFFGTILQWLRSCSVGHQRKLADYGDVKVAGRLLELEQEHLHKWMPPFAVFLEVARRMGRRVMIDDSVLAEAIEGQVITLEEAIGRDEVERLAKACVDFLATIPYRSTFWAQLRGVELDLPEPIRLGPFRLRNVTAEHATQNALLSELLLGTTPTVSLHATDVILEVDVEGYSRQTMADSSVTQALSLLKEFVVLAEAVEVLVRTDRTKFQEPAPLLAELVGDEQAPRWVEDVPPNIARHVDSYTLADDVLRIPPIRGGLLAIAFPGRELTSEERAAEVRSRLVRLERVFDAQADKHVRSLRAAAQWYFDSLAENNETTAFLFVCLGLEALLGGGKGETEGVGLKMLLANRLAYLLGGDRATRERMIRDFSDFYDKRSDLVHGRELRLDRESQQWLTKGREWLRQAIGKEISALLLPPPPLWMLSPPRQ